MASSSSYSAIKIPVPGNLIDTPNAQDGDLLRYNNRVYTNFRPLIINMAPDSRAQSLEFRVSVDNTGSYDADTEAGMFLYKSNSLKGVEDFSLTINSGPYVGAGRATLDVNGNFSLGKTNNILFPDGAARPTDVKNKLVSVLKSDGTIEFQFLDSIINQMDDDDHTIHVSGNSIEVNRDILAQNLYEAKYGVQITGGGGDEDGVSGGIIEADLQWLRTNNIWDTSGQYTSITGGLFKVHGGLSLIDGVISIDGSELAQWFSNGEGITLSTVGETLKIDTNNSWLSTDTNLFTAGTGISIDSATLNTAVALIEANQHGTISNALTLNLLAGDSKVTHARIRGNGNFYATGGWDKTDITGGRRHFVMSLATNNIGDGGVLDLLSADNNNDEFAIKCENMIDALPEGDTPGSEVEWYRTGIDLGSNPFTASNHPTFFVKATTGMMYNSSSYCTEGRILIGEHQDLESCDFGATNNAFRSPRGGGTLFPNIPAHLSIISKTPTLLLHQIGDGVQSYTAPTILLSSSDDNCRDAWGPISGSENAATYLSNRDGSIFQIETTTNYMQAPIWDTDSHVTGAHRFNIVDRAHVWSLDYWNPSGSGGDGNEDTVDYVYMRMGAANHSNSGAGTTYLPVSNTTFPPEGMKLGGFWLDTSVSEDPNNLNNPIVRVYVAGPTN